LRQAIPGSGLLRCIGWIGYGKPRSYVRADRQVRPTTDLYRILVRIGLRCISAPALVVVTGILAATVQAQTVSQPGDGALTAAHVRHRLPVPANPKLPTLFIIGDSTVRNGQGTGTGGQWGWGEPIVGLFDTNKINVVNRALGGTSSRTYYLSQWPGTLALIKPGDFVIMQFGHNDSSPVNDTSRARGTIKGTGEETQTITNLLTQKVEVVHTFGWYERAMVTEARAHGATPMVCSLIPRNTWKEGHVARGAGNYGGWAGEVAHSEHAPFLDINEIIARTYERLGQEQVQALFIAGAGPHTSLAGAQTNAICVVSAQKALQPDPLAGYYSAAAGNIAPADLSQAAAPSKKE
jgi:rhamnogalacturonan acetylesterase